GVVHLRVEKFGGAGKSGRAQFGELVPDSTNWEGPGTTDVVASREEIVQEQPETPLPRRDARSGVEGEHEPERTDEVRRVAQQSAALVQSFVDETKLAVFEVAQTAVYQLRRHAAG